MMRNIQESSVRRFRAPAFVFSALLCLTLQGCAGGLAREAHTGTFERAEVAYRAGDYAATRRLLLPLAKSGDPRAQYVVGYMSFYGQGGTADEKAGRVWIKRSAAGGFPKARIALNRITMAENIRRQSDALPGSGAPARKRRAE
jgi:TPR repeat protein